jgi:hypothetical protein
MFSMVPRGRLVQLLLRPEPTFVRRRARSTRPSYPARELETSETLAASAHRQTADRSERWRHVVEPSPCERGGRETGAPRTLESAGVGTADLQSQLGIDGGKPQAPVSSVLGRAHARSRRSAARRCCGYAKSQGLGWTPGMDPGAHRRLHEDRALPRSHGDLSCQTPRAAGPNLDSPRSPAKERRRRTDRGHRTRSRPLPANPRLRRSDERRDAAALTGGRVHCPKLGR